MENPFAQEPRATSAWLWQVFTGTAGKDDPVSKTSELRLHNARMHALQRHRIVFTSRGC